jgi:hypothetical protein
MVSLAFGSAACRLSFDLEEIEQLVVPMAEENSICSAKFLSLQAYY